MNLSLERPTTVRRTITMYGDISGYSGGKGGGGKHAVGTADFYRRLPRERTEVCN